MLERNRSMPEGSRETTRASSRWVREKGAHWQVGLPASVVMPCPPQEVPAILAVGGGKGGVGKSIISANLSATLARAGLRVLVCDLDFGCANLHTHFGIGHPKRSLTDFLLRKSHGFRDLILPASVENVGFVAGGREEEWGQHLGENHGVLLPLWQAFLTSRRDLGIDVLVLDLGAGTHRHTMEFFTAAHCGIVTVLPEATSIENAYVFLKMALWRLVEHVGHRIGEPETARLVQSVLGQAGGSIERGYLQQLRELKHKHPAFVGQLARAILGRHLGVIVNQTREHADAEIARSMEHICNRYFGFQTTSIGSLNFDEAAWKSSRNRRLLVDDFPHSMIAKKLTHVATETLRLLQWEGA